MQFLNLSSKKKSNFNGTLSVSGPTNPGWAPHLWHFYGYCDRCAASLSTVTTASYIAANGFKMYVFRALWDCILMLWQQDGNFCLVSSTWFVQRFVINIDEIVVSQQQSLVKMVIQKANIHVILEVYVSLLALLKSANHCHWPILSALCSWS